jgi:regulator of protease activity HflC (stomatin/prohibitin superfamily)
MTDIYGRPRSPRSGTTGVPRPVKFGATVVGLLFLLLLSTCTVLGHATTIQSGEVGVLNRTFGANAGVQPQELGPGWHWRGIGEQIIKFSTRQKVHPFQGDEAICFADQTGLQMCGDIQATIQVRPDRAADIYAVRRLDFEALIDTPIRNDLKSFLSQETEKVPVSCNLNPQPGQQGLTPTPAATVTGCTGSLMGSGRQAVLQRAAANLSAKWTQEGVTINDVQWVGSIRYPQAITDAILSRTRIEQETLAAQQQEAKARAQANAQIETARGEAESTKLRAAAIAQSPQLIEQIYAQRSMGLCPKDAKVCIIGGNAWGLVPDAYKQ